MSCRVERDSRDSDLMKREKGTGGACPNAIKTTGPDEAGPMRCFYCILLDGAKSVNPAFAGIWIRTRLEDVASS
jgi:hypothetical protein